MKKSTRMAIVPLVAILLAIGVPVVFAMYLAYNQALSTEMKVALSYATDVQYRSDTATDQINSAFQLLAAMQSSDPCSESNIAVMRRIDVTSSYLQTVGYVSGDQMVCSSYGMHDPVPLGPVDVEHSNGVRIRTSASVPFAIGDTFLVVERNGYAAVVHKDHATDVTTGVINVSLALYSRETGTVLGARGNIRPEWLTLLGDLPQSIVLRDGYIIAAVRSGQYLTASIAAIPVVYLHQIIYDYAAILLPTGIIAGLILVFMVLRILQQRAVLQESTFNLRERVKELDLMHSAARLMVDVGLGDRAMFGELLKLLPPAMLFPELCEARIRYAGIEVSTPGWRDSPWTLSKNFVVDGDNPGSIELMYTQEPPTAAQQIFLAEEHHLLGSLAEMLCAWLKRRQAEDRVAHLAYFERVTGLPNRISLENRLDEAIKDAGIGSHPVALLLLNLGGFRDIVSTLGYRNGDELLRHVAGSLRLKLGDNNLLASMGGDQFVILLTHFAGNDEVDRIIADVVQTLGRPAQVAGIPIKLDVSIGVVIYPEHGDSAEMLMQRSEVALQAAKANHRNHLLYSTAIDHYRPERIALLGELPDAIESGQLVLHYQPKVDLQSGHAIGIEALVRWQHPVRGMIFPDQFIPLAERTQIINPLTRWVLMEALRQCRLWRDAGLDLGLSVNLSTRNLLDTELCESIPDMAHRAGIPLGQLTLEITESAIMADPEQCKRLLDGLHERGVVFSMDDFGVGQSSLSYIKDMPIQKMKIDKSFVMGFSEPRNAAIVNAAIDLGHSLGLQVTAEGVEDEQTLKALKAFGCDIGQGYYFSKPLPADKLVAWLTESVWGYRSDHDHSD